MEGSTSITTKYAERQRNERLRMQAAGEAAAKVGGESTDKSFTEGSRLKARIADFVGKQLTLKLDDGSTVMANTASSRLAIGQYAEFEVIRATPEQLLLKLVSGEQDAADSMAGRALTAAGLPASEEMLGLVNTLLDNRLPVNTETLQTLAKDLKQFPGTDPAILVKMHQNNIPLDQKNITQYDSYLNYEHKLMPKLSELAQSLDSPEVMSFLREAGLELPEITFPVEEPSATSLQDPSKAPEPAFEGTPGAETAQDLQSPEDLSEGAAPLSGEQADAGTLSGTGLPGAADAGEGNAAGNVQNGQAPKPLSEAPAEPGTVNARATAADEAGPAPAARMTGDNVQKAPEDSVSPDRALMSSPAPKADGPVSKEFAGSTFLERWTLSPSDLKKENAVENLFERLNSDLKELDKALRNIKKRHPDVDAKLSGLVESTLKNVEDLRDNLDFMNTLNRFFPYVQLPVRLKDSFRQGELYVYRRNNAKKQDGSASVLLHLDMDSLGQTDIFLSITGNNLTSKFYLEDDTAKLFEDHITELTDRLNALGLKVTCELLPRSESEDPVHEFLAPDAAGDVKHYRFDRKA